MTAYLTLCVIATVVVFAQVLWLVRWKILVLLLLPFAILKAVLRFCYTSCTSFRGAYWMAYYRAQDRQCPISKAH